LPQDGPDDHQKEAEDEDSPETAPALTRIGVKDKAVLSAIFARNNGWVSLLLLLLLLELLLLVLLLRGRHCGRRESCGGGRASGW
jgi:hypothetical protein